ncbi:MULTISPECIES: Imm17 family immunity protein [unclassified Saccharicrinis]|uniref:Imm17 family immunity protein n=1 Tax=unclassified Saccharicrinis TaxID=2646859 RepID=UPI003D329102
MREDSILLNGLFLLFGLVLFVAALINWKYFFGLRKAQMLVNAIGLPATRIIYAILGLFFSLVGADLLMGWGIFNF